MAKSIHITAIIFASTSGVFIENLDEKFELPERISAKAKPKAAGPPEEVRKKITKKEKIRRFVEKQLMKRKEFSSMLSLIDYRVK